MTALAERWNRFWFEPEETSTLAVVRIAFGLVAMAWTATMVADAHVFFAPDGLLPRADYAGRPAGSWGLFDFVEGPAAVSLVMTALFIAAACLTIGHWTRLAAVVVFLGILSLERRNPFVFNSGDSLLLVIAFCMMLAPSGTSLSLDRWRRARSSFWEFPRRAPWALRLMQVQLSVIYFSTVWAKLRGASWNDGTAVGYALGLDDLSRFRPPSFVLDSELVVNLLTYGTLAIEASLAILIWNRRLRPWVMAFGLALHVGIDLTLRVGFFSYAIFVLYAAFLVPETVSACALALRDRLPSHRATPALQLHSARESRR
jgi:hypothetical protein